MIEIPTPIELPPGIYKNGTEYQAKGRWSNGNLIRFIDRTIRPVGGWRRAQDPTGTDIVQLSGVPRKALGWSGDTGAYRIGIGTTEKLFLVKGAVLSDITPVGFVVGNTNGSYTNSLATTGPGSLMDTLNDCDTWQLDNFGDWLVGVCSSDKKLYVWENDPAVVAAEASGAPSGVRGVVVTPERFVVALGDSTSVRKVSWPSQGTTDDWTPSDTNTAGNFDLATTGKIMCGRRTKAQTLIFTDNDVHTMDYIGGVLVYRFDQAGSHCGIVSPNAVVILDGTAIWMGHGNFFGYDGFVQPIPCDVADYVFNDFNEAQRAKVWALSLSKFGEIWWFYPSAASTTLDRYVCYNYREKHWSIGSLARSCGFDAEVTPYPVAITNDGFIYEHEFGDTRTGSTPFLESGPFEIDNGGTVARIQKIIPDDKTLGDVSMTIYSSLAPDDAEVTNGPYTISSIMTDVRITARQLRLRLDEAVATAWRVGTVRLGIIPGSRR